MQIDRRTVDAAEPQRLREGRRRDACGLVAHQLFAGQEQELGLALALLVVPALEARAAVHVGGDLLVVEGMDQLVVDQHVLTT